MSSSRRPGEKIDIAPGAATPVLDIFKVALDLVPMSGGTGLVPKALSALADRVEVARANKTSREFFIGEVMVLGSVIQRTLVEADALVTRYDGDVDKRREALDAIAHSKELQSGVQELLSTIEELKEQISELKGGAGFRGSLKGVMYGSRNEAVLESMLEKLMAATGLFERRGRIAIQDESQRLWKEAKEAKILELIPRVPASYRAQVVDQLKGKFMAGTREVLFEELDLWATGCFPEDEPKRFYFLSGGAGLGKSSVAHQLCVRLDNSKQTPRLGASFFFIRSEESLSSSLLFFSTLAHQLALSQSTLRLHIVTTVSEYFQRADFQNMGSAFKDLLRRVFSVALTTSDPSPLFLVIDGLDECKELSDLLQCLLSLVREFPWLYVFVASRPEPHIMAALTSAEVDSIVYHRSLDDTLEDWSGDVELYLEKTISKVASYANFVRDHPDDWRRLVERSAGVFIYARVAISFLEVYNSHPEEQFALLLSREGGVGLSPLDALYLQVLRSAFPPADLHKAPLQRERLLSFLQVVLLRDSPSPPSQIAFLGSGVSEMSEEDVVRMLDSLRSVLLINGEGKVTPLHATFREFLLDNKRCVDPMYHVDEAKGHVHLALGCLAAFSIKNVTEYLANPSSAIGGYVYYATLLWSAHCVGAQYDDELENRLRTFVQGDVQAIYQRARRRVLLVLSTNADIVVYVAQFLKTSRHAKEICSEFAKFTAFSISWYQQVAKNPDMPPDQLHANFHDVARELRKIARGVVAKGCSVELDLTLQYADMERYQAAHAELAREICQDDQARKLWYSMDNDRVPKDDLPDSEDD